MIESIIFIIGTFIGSFLTVVIDRLPRNVSIVRGRSFCDSCKHTLSILDLVPVFSFIFLQGKCRYCKKKIGVHHFLLEIVVGILFVITYLATLMTFPGSLVYTSLFLATLLYRLLLVCVFFVIFFIDLKHSIIPFATLVFAGIVSVVWTIIFMPSLLLSSFLAALGAFLFFYFIHFLTKGRGMGFGDVLYAFVMGFILGFPTIIVGVYIAFLTGSVLSLILILSKRKKLKSAIPFGPFLVFGTVACLLWGSQLTHAFLVLLRII